MLEEDNMRETCRSFSSFVVLFVEGKTDGGDSVGCEAEEEVQGLSA